MDQGDRKPRETNPRENANFFSIFTFLYTRVLFKKACVKDLEEDDVYEVMPVFKSKKLGSKLEKRWLKANENDKKTSLLWLLASSYGSTYLCLGIVQLVMKTVLVFLQPRALKNLVAYFKKGQTTFTQNDAYYYGGLLIALNIISCIYNHNYMQLIAEFGMKVRIAFCSLIYRKSLKLSSSSLSFISIGKIVTLLTKDAFNFEVAFMFMNDVWIGVIQAIIVTYLIYEAIGCAAFTGMGFLILIIPLQVYLGKKTSLIRIESSRRTDERVQTTQETISAIKIIKMYTWEKFFEDKVSNARRSELNKLRNIYYLKALSLVIGGLNMNIATYLSIITYIWIGNTVTAATIFYLISLYQMLRSFITTSIPLGISQTAELVATLERLKVLFEAEEVEPDPPNEFTKNSHNNHKLQTIKENSEEEKVLSADSNEQPKVYLRNVSVKLNDTEVLKDVSLSVESGLHIITGPVGAGKSSLLKTILREYPVQRGTILVNGTVSYASEEPWLFPSTIKHNILFGETCNEKRYQEVLRVCALTYDINSFDKGDDTVIGDSGINLSKGQQARINLARAVYRDKDIYLLDDCLTALDANVNKYVFQECIKGFLKNKVCILITHNVNHLKNCNDIVIMEDGKTLSLEKQKAALDKRITYYIDDENDTKFDDDGEQEQNEEDRLLTETSTMNKDIYHEDKKSGQVEYKIYLKYFKFCGGLFVAVLLLMLFFVSQFATSYSEKLVGTWVNSEDKITNLTERNMTNTTQFSDAVEENDHIMDVYTTMVIVSAVLSLARAYFHFFCTSKASVNLNRSMVSSVLNAQMTFFDTHYIGNILNRFSKDLATIDEYLPFVLYECVRCVFIFCGVIGVISIGNPIYLLPATAIIVFLYFLRQYYMPTGRSLRRLDAAVRSPMVGHVNSTLQGITSIRAYRTESIITDEFDRHQDHFSSVFYMGLCTGRAFALCLDMLCSMFIAVIIITCLSFGKDSAGDVGVAITQATMLTGLLQWGVRQWSELENCMTSVERVMEYTDVKKENKQGRVLKDWPIIGKISYENVYLTYSSTKEQVLYNINLLIEGGSKIGIVGRTGAGKSSIISSLFRIYEFQGKILIDDVDIKTLSLEFLRSNIGIIPQDPKLFTGTIRSNIDPTGKYTDMEIWRAVEKVKINELVESLDHKITESGCSYSAGQKQLICLVRALVCKNKIIVLDEATANMDPETDHLLHSTIAENFADCTILTIAHRLHSVLASDNVIVVDGGRIVEFDNPTNLLRNKKSLFYKMVHQTTV